MIILVIIFSMLIGSFLNMLIYRLPRMIKGENISLINPTRSFCPQCKHTLKTIDLLPIISFLISFGQCRYCLKKIGLQYLMVEVISVFISIILFNIIGFKLELIYFLILAYSLIVLFFIDNKHLLLPDVITIPILWLGLIYNLQFGNISASIIGAIFGYLSLWSLFWIFKILRNKEGLGYGDFKFVAMIGAWFGLQILPIWLLLGSILGIIFYLFKIKNKDKHFALAPSFIIALPIVLLINTYINIIY